MLNSTVHIYQHTYQYILSYHYFLTYCSFNVWCSREHSCQDSHGMDNHLKWAEKYTLPIKSIELEYFTEKFASGKLYY